MRRKKGNNAIMNFYNNEVVHKYLRVISFVICIIIPFLFQTITFIIYKNIYPSSYLLQWKLNIWISYWGINLLVWQISDYYRRKNILPKILCNTCCVILCMWSVICFCFDPFESIPRIVNLLDVLS